MGQRERETPEAAVERVREAIQAARLEQLGEEGLELKVRGRVARDIVGLWYLRTEIMKASATQRGEVAAHACMTRLILLFKGHHPGATTSRFSSL